MLDYERKAAFSHSAKFDKRFVCEFKLLRLFAA